MKTALLSLVTALSLSTLTFAAAPVGTANWGQADLVNDWTCTTTPTAIPGLSLSLTTTGGPVLLMITVSVALPEGVSSVEPATNLVPVVDAQAVSTDGITSPPLSGDQPFVLTFSRVYPLMAGVHTFGASLQCPPTLSVVTRAWLTAYELPLIKK